MLLGDHDLLLYLLLQVILFLGQHFLGLPQSVDGLLRRRSASGPVFGPGGARRARARAAALEQFRDFAHSGNFESFFAGN